MMQRISFILFVLLNHVLGKLVLRPEHTESTVGGDVVLNCITDYTSVSDPVEWRYKPEPTVLFELVYTSGFIVNGFYERFSVKGDHDKGEYHLVISNVSLNDAGIYTCADMEGDTQKAELVVFQSFPSEKSCRVEAPSDGIIGDNSCGIPPDTVRLSCSMKYRGNIVPTMQWRSLDGDVITEGIQNEAINGNTVSTLVLNGNQTKNRKYVCIIVYANPTVLSNYSWIATTKALQIEDVRDVAMIECDQQWLNCSNDTSHSCTYAWADNSSVSNDNQTLHLSNKPNGRYICMSKCRIRGVICSTVSMNVVRQCSNDAKNNHVVIYASVVTGLTVVLLATGACLVWRIKSHTENTRLPHQMEMDSNGSGETKLLRSLSMGDFTTDLLNANRGQSTHTL